MRLQVSGTLTVEDFIASTDLQESLYQRLGMYLQIAFIAIGAGLWLSSIAPRIGMVVAALGLADMIGERLWAHFVTPRKSRKLFETLTDLHGRIRYEIDDEGIRVRNGNGDFHHDWSAYVDFGEDERVFILSRSETMLEILPKRWFPDPVSLGEFRDFAQARVLRNLELESPAES